MVGNRQVYRSKRIEVNSWQIKWSLVRSYLSLVTSPLRRTVILVINKRREEKGKERLEWKTKKYDEISFAE